jgi:hypothetical protein
VRTGEKLAWFLAIMFTCATVLAADTVEKLFSRIPPASPAKSNVDAQYRFTVDYVNADAQGAPTNTQRAVGEYTFNAATGEIAWQSVTTGSAPGFPAEIAATTHQPYMEGLRYGRSADTLSAEFYAKFPPQAVQEKNLVLDTRMFDEFVHGYFDKLQPNVAIPFKSGTVALGGSGSFHNNDVRLTWTGVSRRNGRTCALVHYEAFLNTFTTTVPGMKIVGRSEYWGDMWVAFDTRAIEYATLREEVVGRIESEQAGSRPMHVMRIAAIERIK